jgi:hypothetical protein
MTSLILSARFCYHTNDAFFFLNECCCHWVLIFNKGIGLMGMIAGQTKKILGMFSAPSASKLTFLSQPLCLILPKVPCSKIRCSMGWGFESQPRLWRIFGAMVTCYFYGFLQSFPSGFAEPFTVGLHDFHRFPLFLLTA